MVNPKAKAAVKRATAEAKTTTGKGQKNGAQRPLHPSPVETSARSRSKSADPGEGAAVAAAALRRCGACGRPFAPRSKRTRFCDDAGCRRQRDRARKQRARGGRPAPAPRVGETPGGDVVPPAAIGELANAVRRELERLRQVDTLVGQMAVSLAERIDRSLVDTGSSYASLMRELRSTMEAAELAGRPAGPVERLRRKSEERRRGS